MLLEVVLTPVTYKVIEIIKKKEKIDVFDTGENIRFLTCRDGAFLQLIIMNISSI